MKQKYVASSGITNGNKLSVMVRRISDGNIQTESITVKDVEVLKRADDIIGFPLEELEYGLFDDDFDLKEILKDAVSQARRQVRNSKLYKLKKTNK